MYFAVCDQIQIVGNYVASTVSSYANLGTRIANVNNAEVQMVGTKQENGRSLANNV